MNRAFSNILTRDVSSTAQFYQDLFGMKRTGDFGWFVILSHDDMPGFELGILDHSHDTIPDGVVANPSGTILTFVVESVENVHANAVAMSAEIIEGLTDLPYGQRRLMLRDPAGTAVDVSADSLRSPSCH